MPREGSNHGVRAAVSWFDTTQSLPSWITVVVWRKFSPVIVIGAERG
jgi:hypothetical protein